MKIGPYAQSLLLYDKVEWLRNIKLEYDKIGSVLHYLCHYRSIPSPVLQNRWAFVTLRKMYSNSCRVVVIS